MTLKILFISVAAALLLAGGAYFFLLLNHQPLPENSTISNEEETEVRSVVSGFGKVLQMVTLYSEERGEAMRQHYAPYVTSERIEVWAPEGAEGIGRYSSSPYPDRIEIVEVRKELERYVVEGNVIEVTDDDSGAGKSAAAVYPVTLTLEKQNDHWMITHMQKGAYAQLPQRQTITGFWECLPVKDTSVPPTLECAFGIAVDQSDGHFAVNTMLMSTYPVDYPVGTKVQVTGVVTPANMLSSIQKYDIDGIINATQITPIQ